MQLELINLDKPNDEQKDTAHRINRAAIHFASVIENTVGDPKFAALCRQGIENALYWAANYIEDDAPGSRPPTRSDSATD